MKKFLIYIVFFMLLIFSSSAVNAKKIETENGIKISNRYFSVIIPDKLQGTYIVKKKTGEIFIYEKEAKKAGFGGFAFGIKAYKNPSEHAMMPGGQKIGELVIGKKSVYDMVLIQPTDVQFDYTKGEPKSYLQLYNLAKDVDVTGNFCAKYVKNQGMKGENLYKDILNKHLTAIKEKWNSQKLEEENMSYMYNVIAQSSQNVLDKIGYAYFDINGDGIDELFIGEIAQNNWKGIIYDIYTMVNRKPVHVVSGGSRNRYFACDDGFLCNEYSESAGLSGLRVYNLIENSTELYPQVFFKYDSYTNKNKPWFISYCVFENKWENVSKELFYERKKIFEKYERFNYIPFSKIINK